MNWRAYLATLRVLAILLGPLAGGVIIGGLYGAEGMMVLGLVLLLGVLPLWIGFIERRNP